MESSKGTEDDKSMLRLKWESFPRKMVDPSLEKDVFPASFIEVAS